VRDCVLVFEVVLEHDSQQLGFGPLFENSVVDSEDWAYLHRLGVEDGEVGLCRVWDEVVGMEVVDEAAEFGLR
jgi:hypothetical protein